MNIYRQNINSSPNRHIPSTARPTRELLKYVPQLSLTERDRRWRNMKRRMIMAGLDALIFIGNDIFWDTGLANMRYMFQMGAKQHGWALFPIEGDPVVWHSVPHINRPFNPHLTNQEWLSDFRVFPGAQGVAAEIETRGFARSRIGLVIQFDAGSADHSALRLCRLAEGAAKCRIYAAVPRAARRENAAPIATLPRWRRVVSDRGGTAPCRRRLWLRAP